MPSTPARFRQAELERAIRAAEKLGMAVRIAPGGAIEIIEKDSDPIGRFLRDCTEPWTADDFAAYRARWPEGTRQRLAMEFLLLTGLRRGDAVRAGRQHVRGGILRIKAEKTGTDLFIPFPDSFMARMNQGGGNRMHFIVGADGNQMTKESFGNSLREWCEAAGVSKSAHGIRKAAAAIDAENGATELELQSKYGWLTNTQSAIYTRGANREALARSLGQKSNGYSLSRNQLRERSQKTQ